MQSAHRRSSAPPGVRAEQPQFVREVTVTELRERTASVIERVGGGEVAVVSRHGRPLAVLMPLADCEGLSPATANPQQLAELAQRFERRRLRREWSALMHGRWWQGHGIHGPYFKRER